MSLAWANGDRNPITVSLQTDNAGVPSNTSLETWVATPSADGVFDFNFTSTLKPLLASGTPYWLVQETLGVGAGRGWVISTKPGLLPLAGSANLGSTWQIFQGEDILAFRVEGTAPVPEPAYWQAVMEIGRAHV